VNIDIKDYGARFGNQHHPYTFPHIMGMIGDGNTEYDVGTDGFNQQAGSCSVRRPYICVARAAASRLTIHALRFI